jgi:hypothetical protein
MLLTLSGLSPHGRLSRAGSYCDKFGFTDNRGESMVDDDKARLIAFAARAHAKMGLQRAMNRNVQRVLKPSRTDHPHRGRRELARDR